MSQTLTSATKTILPPKIIVPPASRDPLNPTVFHNEWWLRAATGGDYQEATIRAGNQVVARFPYVIERKFTGQRQNTMPEMTHFLGPAIDAGTGSAINRDLKIFQRTQALLKEMAPFGGFYHKLHGGIGDVLAFQDAGFDASVQFTYLLQPQPERAIWQGMRDKTRNVIRRAEERWKVLEFDDPEAFAFVYGLHLRERKLTNYYTRITAVCRAAIEHGQGRILAVKDQDGSVLGAVFIVWDHTTAYYLLATRALGSENGVMSLLVWHAIRGAIARGLVFDFDGVGTPGSRLFFAGFGGTVAPRYIVSKYTALYRIAGQITKHTRRLRGG